MTGTERFGLIGCGRAGGTLARELLARGWQPAGVLCSRSTSTAQAVSFLGAGFPAATAREVATSAPLTLVATPDRLLRPAARELAEGGRLDGVVVLHLSGSHDAEVLAPVRAVGAAVGSCHPLVSLAGREGEPGSLAGVSFAVDGDPAALHKGLQLARTVGGRPFESRPAGRTLYHAGAVLASNALVALVDLAASLVAEAGLDQDRAVAALLPLVRSTLANVEARGLEAALTGPVRRGDAETVRRHLALLPSGPARAAYVALSRQALDLARRAGLDEASATALEIVLAEAE